MIRQLRLLLMGHPQQFAGVQGRRSGNLPTDAGQPANGWRARIHAPAGGSKPGLRVCARTPSFKSSEIAGTTRDTAVRSVKKAAPGERRTTIIHPALRDCTDISMTIRSTADITYAAINKARFLTLLTRP